MHILKLKKLNLFSNLKKIGNLAYVLIILLIISASAVLVISTVKIPGNYKFLIVESGSMEPAILRGAIVITKPEADYKKNDIITISESANSKVSLTHRIVGIEKRDGNTLYTTKGDANEDPDAEKRFKKNVVGKALFSIPFLGFVVDFAKTKSGLLLLIIIPCMLIIFNEAINIKKEALIIFKKRKYA